MRRGIIVVIFVLMAGLLIFSMIERNAGAQNTPEIGQVLENQKIILEKLQVLEKKIDIIKMRIKI